MVNHLVGIDPYFTTSPIQYAGGYTDQTSGLIYLLNRWYDPNTGAFLTPDPLVALTGTPYAYAGDNPIDNIDPLGLSWYDPTTWTPEHQVVAIGLILGGLAVVTGGAALAAEGPMVLALGTVSTADGIGATALDIGPCRREGGAACAAVGLGLGGSILSAAGVTADLAVVGGLMEEGSTAHAWLQGLGVGLGGGSLGIDAGLALAGLGACA